MALTTQESPTGGMFSKQIDLGDVTGGICTITSRYADQMLVKKITILK